MFHNDIQSQLGLLVKTSAAPLIEVAQSATETPEWQPGQRLPAHVIASLPNGRFHVMVEDQVLDMNLPRNTQPGDKLDLVYVTDKPRATFALASDLAKALPTSSNNVSLSQTGKFIGALLQQPKTQAQVGTAGTNALSSAQPLITSTPTSVQQFATALRDAISQSGLFYESHQAQWASGGRSMESLLQEPQGKLSLLQPEVNTPSQTQPQAQTKSQNQIQPQNQIQSQTQAVDTNKAGAATLSQTVSPRSNTLPLDQGGRNTLNFVTDTTQPITGGATSSASSGAVGIHDPISPLSAPIVQQQLNVLDTRQIFWQGQIWPGQNMEWMIEEDAHRQSEYEDEGSVWRTRLHLDFPSLGGVTANLSFGVGGINVDFSVDQVSSASLMQGEVASLAQSMETSGLKVAGMVVRKNGSA